MLYTLAILLIILWLLGIGFGYTFGSFIHILFVIAVGLLIADFIFRSKEPL